MRLPDFLVIGAMKAGTTTFCRDLGANPGVFFPSVKEPHTLCLNRVLTPDGKQEYAELFKDAGADQLCGEGSTGYTKLPTHRGVPQRALRVLGRRLRLIYIVREPVSRAISHHYHLYRSGDAPASMADALQKIPSIIHVGRYAMQLKPWLDLFGPENIHLVQFERYIDARQAVVQKAHQFLGLTPEPASINEEMVLNSGEEQLLPPEYLKNFIRRITRSQFYKRKIHPLTPSWARDLIKEGIYQEAPPRPEPPSADIIKQLTEIYRPEVEALQLMLGLDKPLWDQSRVQSRYASPPTAPNETK